MRKNSQKQGKKEVEIGNGIVEASGSTPLCSTITLHSKDGYTFDIPDDFEPIPAVQWINGMPHLYRVLRKISKT